MKLFEFFLVVHSGQNHGNRLIGEHDDIARVAGGQCVCIMLNVEHIQDIAERNMVENTHPNTARRTAKHTELESGQHFVDQHEQQENDNLLDSVGAAGIDNQAQDGNQIPKRVQTCLHEVDSVEGERLCCEREQEPTERHFIKESV